MGQYVESDYIKSIHLKEDSQIMIPVQNDNSENNQLIEQRKMLQTKFSKDSTSTSYILSNSDLDQKFLDKLNLVMEKQLNNPEFSIDDFSTKLNLGRTSFFLKVKGVTGFTPNEYMRIFRLKKAMELLKEGTRNVSKVSYMVGINDTLYFSRYFKKQFGVAPSTLLRGSKENGTISN